METIMTLATSETKDDVIWTADGYAVSIGHAVYDKATGTEFVISGFDRMGDGLYAILKETKGNCQVYLDGKCLYKFKENRQK